MKTKAADILGLRSGEISLLSTRGYNSVALLKTSVGSIHKYAGFPEAVVKIFRRDCPRERFAKIARWHNGDFGKFPILKSKNFQQSLGAGEYVDKFGKVYFYAVMEYIPGTLLQDFGLELRTDFLRHPGSQFCPAGRRNSGDARHGANAPFRHGNACRRKFCGWEKTARAFGVSFVAGKS